MNLGSSVATMKMPLDTTVSLDHPRPTKDEMFIPWLYHPHRAPLGAEVFESSWPIPSHRSIFKRFSQSVIGCL